MLKSKFNSSNKWTWQFSRFHLRLLTLLCRIEKHESLARLGSSLLNLLWVVAALSSHFALTARGSGVPVWLRKAGFVRNCFSEYTIPGLKDWVSCQLLVFCYFWNFLAVFSDTNLQVMRVSGERPTVRDRVEAERKKENNSKQHQRGNKPGTKNKKSRHLRCLPTK